MSVSSQSHQLVQVVTLLGAAVVAVPLFRRLGLGSVLGYLCAGLVIGPFGLQLFSQPNSILHVAELGVVMFLFVIGLEMRPSHLWKLKSDIFVLGSAQILACSTLLTLAAWLSGLPLTTALIAVMGFSLTSTAIVMQLLNERGESGLASGQKIVSVLLFEDLLIVPLLATVAILSPLHQSNGFSWNTLFVPLIAITSVVAAGLWMLNPLFRILAAARAREVLTAAALLVVLGAALLMQLSGLSMAMGAFLAGVLLSESSFRHQIEADIEPFRGILLGLFFIGVGMSLNLPVVLANAPVLFAGVVVLMLGKAGCVYVVARLLGSDSREALNRSLLMAQGGEFAFVLYAAAAQAGVISAEVNANMTAIVVLSMALTPLVVLVARKFLPQPQVSLDGIETPRDLENCVLLIGFGRFGQVVSQLLLARNLDVTIIDSDPDMIRSAEDFGFKIYYGDGTRLDVLRSSGAEQSSIIAVCVEQQAVANRIVDLVKNEFPHARLLVRSYDRGHARELVLAGVDYQIRETFESALLLGQQALRQAEVPEEEIISIAEDIRRRDRERFELEVTHGDPRLGRDLLLGNIPKPIPVPFTPPKQASTLLNDSEVP